ncbi:MAG: helix-turn-helix domain-containing protein [Chloroflexi bacterium]|nr:helix-turn-helix domain-containing protein [Chloroflexota bacterium]
MLIMKQVEDIGELLTISEAARALRVSAVTVRRHIAQGEIRAVRVGRQVRVSKEALAAFVKPLAKGKASTHASRRRTQPLTSDDPLWKLVGSATDAPPTDSSRKYDYLADTMAPQPNA